jgi:O-Antigen ligase
MFVAVASRRGGRVVAAVQRAAASGTLMRRGGESDRASVRRHSRSGIGSRPGKSAFSTTGTNEAAAPAIASGKADASPGGALRRRATGAAGLLLLVAVAAGLLGQGAYYGSMQRYVGLLVAVATVLALAGWPPTRSDAGLLPVAPALALAAWTVLDAALLGVPGAGVGPALLLLGAVALLLVCRRLGPEDREVLLLGVVGIGLVVALAGWLGVAGHIDAWVWQDPHVWRASSTLSYPNATAAVLVPVALLVLARLAEAPRSLPLVLAATGLLAGLGATASRAGALALVIGLVVLAGLRGPRGTARATVGPCAGALLALVCLVPSMPVASQPRPALALVGLAAGLALAGTVARLGRWPALALVLGGALMGGLALIATTGGADNAARVVAQARINLASPDRGGALRAAVGVIAEHPLVGAGPGQADLQQRGQNGGTRFFGYAHNEYAQIAAELGLVGLVLLGALLLALARLLWRARATGPAGATWAGVVAATAAFAVHSGFDFVWHLPAVLLAVLLLVGVVLPAPGGADARKGSVTSSRKEPDENQSTN